MQVWTFFQFAFSIIFWFPLILILAGLVRRPEKQSPPAVGTDEFDYAIIVTAYQQTDFLKDVVDSILKSTYSNYLIYIVADNCDTTNLDFGSDKVILLKPEKVLAGNIKSHLYAIERFRRKHNLITIIDSDNLVNENYLQQLNLFFSQGFKVVQGVRRARNLNTHYARLDEASDIYYRFVDRKLTFEAGASATLAGSGMAFNSDLYLEAISRININGAGFDKMLQYELVQSGERLAFNENAIVLDGRTTNSDQLLKQRARWISAWAKAWVLGWKLFFKGLIAFNWNKLAFSQVLLRPPLFMLLMITGGIMLVDLFVQPFMIFYWILCLIFFIIIFFKALNYFKAAPEIYTALRYIPKFMFIQILALFKAKKANQISVATKHEIENK